MARRGAEAAGLFGRETPGPGHEPAHAVLPPFKSIYRDNFDFVWSSARGLGVEPSGLDDVVQEVFITVHARLHTLEHPQALRSWIYGIVRRTISNQRRARRARPDTTADAPEYVETVSPGPTPFEETERSAGRELLMRLLDALDEPKREIFTLVDVHEMSVPEAADALGIPLNTAYSRLRVARQLFDLALARHEARGQGAR